MKGWALALWFGLLCPSAAFGAPVAVLAAENVYGDIAKQLGGGDVSVSSVLSNPDQDPHLFEASPSVARQVAAARIVVLNGMGYDPWMERLLAAAPVAGRAVLVAGTQSGQNPHVWYDLPTVAALARNVTDALSSADPEHQAGYAARLQAFLASLKPIETRITALRSRLDGVPAAATEPVFGYGLAALGMVVRGERFALAVMRDTEPAPSDVAAFENDLRQHRVRVLIHNSQTAGPVAARMERIARAAGIPVVGVSETEPAGLTYQAWMLRTLDAIDHAVR